MKTFCNYNRFWLELFPENFRQNRHWFVLWLFSCQQVTEQCINLRSNHWQKDSYLFFVFNAVCGKESFTCSKYIEILSFAGSNIPVCPSVAMTSNSSPDIVSVGSWWRRIKYHLLNTYICMACNHTITWYIKQCALYRVSLLYNCYSTLWNAVIGEELPCK